MEVMPGWWNGRDLRALLPRLFLVHFNDTSLIAEDGGELAGFLVGFLSPARPDEGYVHFVGVHPSHRGKGLARELYARFFDLCVRNGRSRVRACTSPVNRASIDFHRRLGFTLEAGDAEDCGVPVTLDYNRPGDAKVLFVRSLQSAGPYDRSARSQGSPSNRGGIHGQGRD